MALQNILRHFPKLYFIGQFLTSVPRSSRMSLDKIHRQFGPDDSKGKLAVDLGCGTDVKNRFGAERSIGVDLVENSDKGIIRCELGFESIPLETDSVDFLTAYDLIEHIPRHSRENGCSLNPFIFFMNECHRILKPGGIFLSHTPIYPFFGAFQDPTHNNIITSKTFRLYFSNQRDAISTHYGVTCDFEILSETLLGQSLVAVLKK